MKFWEFALRTAVAAVSCAATLALLGGLR